MEKENYNFYTIVSTRQNKLKELREYIEILKKALTNQEDKLEDMRALIEKIDDTQFRLFESEEKKDK